MIYPICSRIFAGALMLLTLAAVSPLAAQSGSRAMITGLRGAVTVARGSTATRDARILQKLEKGDVLKGSKGSSLTVTFFGDGHTERISGLFSAEVQDNALKSSTARIDSKSTLKLLASGMAPRPVEIERAGIQTSRDIDIVKALSPADNEVVVTTTPRFEWYVKAGASWNARYFVLENLS